VELRALLERVDPAASIAASAVPDDRQIDAIVHDSRAVGPGALFCALVGDAFDGHRFVPEAIRRGAVAVLVRAGTAVSADADVAVLHAADTRVAMAHLAAAHAGHPSRDLEVVGVTGTNGKTTTVHLLAHVASSAGVSARTMGTLTGARTTPEATDIQPLLATWRAEQVQMVAMEVSSHALAQHRVDGIRFRVAGFTNLSEDHLDYHPSMNEYFAAKARLFTPELSERAVVVADRPHGRLLVDTATIPVTAIHPDEHLLLGSSLTHLEFEWRDRRVRLPFGGRFNAANAILAAELAVALGLPVDQIAAGLQSAPPVPGRFEPVVAGQPFGVIVDYAHTPDSLTRVLASVREDAHGGNVIVVFGCGGDRDAAKRPLMGQAAEQGADRVIITSDNPRSEDADAIISDVQRGMTTSAVVVPDRREAIAAALRDARPGDVVVIAGKGHETTQIIGSESQPFDDRLVARDILDAPA